MRMSHKHRKKSRRRRRRRTRRKKVLNKMSGGGDSYSRNRKKQKRMKPCGKYYKGEYNIDKRCKKDKNCRYIDMGSGGEWCYPALTSTQKVRQAKKKKDMKCDPDKLSGGEWVRCLQRQKRLTRRKHLKKKSHKKKKSNSKKHS